MDRMEAHSKELRVQIGDLRERMAHLEGLLEGLREAITRTRVGLNPKLPSFALCDPERGTFPVPETVDGVIIHHAGCLHVSVHDGTCPRT